MESVPPRLDQLPLEIVNEIVKDLNLRDLHHLEESYNFDYSLLDLPDVIKPIDAQKAFSNYNLFLQYRQRYQRTFLNSKEIRLALNGGQPQILYDLYENNFLPFETFLATLVIKGQDQFLESLDLREFYPWFDLNPYEVYPSLIISGIIYLTWGTYSQIQSFFTRYEAAGFEPEYWLKSHHYPAEYVFKFESFRQLDSARSWVFSNLSVYENIMLFPYHCTEAEYLRLLQVDWLPDYFRSKIEDNLSRQKQEILKNLLFLGRDLRLFRLISQRNIVHASQLLSPFTQNIPILGQPLIEAPFVKRYTNSPEIMTELPYSQFKNEEALWLVLNQSQNYLLTQQVDIIIAVMKHAIASDLISLFSQLWDLMIPNLLEDLEGHSKYRYAQIIDATLSVDNPQFFEKCQRRDLDLYETVLFLPGLEKIIIPVRFYSDESYTKEELLTYLFTYHRLIAFERIKSALDLDLLAQLSNLETPNSTSLAPILASSFHYGTLMTFLKQSDSEISAQDWTSIILTEIPNLRLDLEDKKFLGLTWVTDQPIAYLSDLVLTIRRLIPPALPVYRLFFVSFNQDLKLTKLFINLIFMDNVDLWDLIYYFYLPQMMDQEYEYEIENRQDFRIKLVIMILKRIYNNFNMRVVIPNPINITYRCLEILREESPDQFIFYRELFRRRYFRTSGSLSQLIFFNYARQPELMSFLNYLTH